jgi:Raf kinase inhibitor-like YbhB/YbcL family protein
MLTPHAGFSRLAAASFLLIASAATGCHGAQQPELGADSPQFQLTSPSFTNNGRIPSSLTCDGANTSPALQWSDPPAATKSFALIFDDPDAAGDSFLHWTIYNVPATAHSLAATEPKQGQLPDGSRQGRNDFGDAGYGGPCPPGHREHHYRFVLYAVDTRLNLPAGATRKQIEDALKGHIVAHGKLVGLYSR